MGRDGLENPYTEILLQVGREKKKIMVIVPHVYCVRILVDFFPSKEALMVQEKLYVPLQNGLAALAKGHN